jgi:SAM-dependent methyltransferase
MSDRPWYEEFFDEEYFRIYAGRLTEERTAREVDGIVTLLDLPPGSAILDLCCGHGRIAIPLAERGYRVTGQDLSEVFLRRARVDAAARGASIDWIHSDMRRIPFTEEFDDVLNIFTSFGYLESESEAQKVLEGIAAALKPGGRFLIEIIHRESVIRRYCSHHIERHDDGLIVLNEGAIDLLTSTNPVKLTLLYPDGRRRETGHAARLYSLTDLARLLAAAGLPVEAYFGGLNGSELTLDSRRLVVIARKPTS